MTISGAEPQPQGQHGDRLRSQGPRPLLPLLVALLFAAAAWGGWELYRRGLESALHNGSATVAPGVSAGASGAAPAADIVAQLEQHLQRRPDDARALVLLARQYLQADRFDQAAAAYEKALAVSTRVARDAGVWVELAEAKGLAQGGRLSGAPVQLIERALAIDAVHPRALDLAGSAAWEARDFAGAARHWLVLLDQIPPDDSRRVELQAAIDAAKNRARFSLPSLP